MTINTLNLESGIGEKRVEHLWSALSPGVGVKNCHRVALSSRLQDWTSQQQSECLMMDECKAWAQKDSEFSFTQRNLPKVSHNF